VTSSIELTRPVCSAALEKAGYGIKDFSAFDSP